MSFAQPPTPKTGLGYLRVLSPTAAVKVSPLCLGGMNFGEAWKDFLGECNRETTEEILDYFYESGGNFIDTSNNYQKGESEQYIGEWMKKRGVRDQMVIATKYTTAFPAKVGDISVLASRGGNSSKSLHISVQKSLEKLQTDYIDLLYIHWWDHVTSIPEMMHSLNDVIASGKVLYIGASDTPAWIVSKANQYARDHGLRQFSVYQGQWSAANRDFEREIIPMTIAEGMSLAPWGALGGGQFKSEEQRKAGEGRKTAEIPEKVLATTKVLEKLAKEKNTAITSIALAYVMQKTPYVFPIVGGRKIEHIKGNIEALSLELSKEDIEAIEGAAPFDLGFPHTMLGGSDPAKSWLINMGGHFQYVEGPKAIPPHKK